jgi:hypothetical protein
MWNLAQAKLRDDLGFGGYMIGFSENCIMDNFFVRDLCFASMANSPCNLVDTNDMRVFSNATLYIDRIKQVASLVATKTIPPNSEILWDYGNKYSFWHNH